jgi:hypothetical protein
MELLPPTPKIQRKFPVQEPLGEPAGPIDLFGRGPDSSQALSIGTRRSAGTSVAMNASTLSGFGAATMADPEVRKDQAMLADIQMPKNKVFFKQFPAGLTNLIKNNEAMVKSLKAQLASPAARRLPVAKADALKARLALREQILALLVSYKTNGINGIPANLDIPPSQMAYPMIRAEALGQIPQLLRADRLPLMLNPNLGLKVGLPGELNVPPSYLAVPQIRREANFVQSPSETMRQFRLAMDHTANNKRLAGLGAGVSQPQKLMIPETDGSYDANAFSSNYVDRIKAAVRIDYGEQQYAGYANAARAAQYQSPAFVGATYNYPEAFMRRGVSLAGGLGVAPGFSKLATVKAGAGKRALRQIGGGNSWEALTQLAEVPEGGYLYIDNTDSKSFPAPQNNLGIVSYDVVKATISKDGNPVTGYIIWQLVKSDGSTVPAIEAVSLPPAAVAAIGALKSFLGKTPGVVEQMYIQLLDPGVQGRLVGEISTLVGLWGSLNPVDRYNKIVDIFEGLGANVSPDLEILILGRRASEVPGAKTAANFSGSGVVGTNNPPASGKVPSWVWWTVGGIGGAAVLGTVLYFAFRKN